MSAPSHARAAAERAIATGVAAATAGFQLTQDAETATGVGSTNRCLTACTPRRLTAAPA